MNVDGEDFDHSVILVILSIKNSLFPKFWQANNKAKFYCQKNLMRPS